MGGATGTAAAAAFSESLKDFVKSKSKSSSDGTGGLTCPVTFLIPSGRASADAGVYDPLASCCFDAITSSVNIVIRTGVTGPSRSVVVYILFDSPVVDLSCFPATHILFMYKFL